MALGLDNSLQQSDPERNGPNECGTKVIDAALTDGKERALARCGLIGFVEKYGEKLNFGRVRRYRGAMGTRVQGEA
jgi:hypothetical protein